MPGDEEAHDWPQSQYRKDLEVRRIAWRKCNICGRPTVGVALLDVPLCWRSSCRQGYRVKIYLVTLLPVADA